MIRKYITITIVPTSSKKVKRFQVSLFNVFLLVLILSGVILHAGWVFRTFLIEETTYGAQSIKTKFEKQKVFLSQYNKDVANLNQSIEELNDYHYKLGKIFTITKNTESPKESATLIKQVQKGKKSIFALIATQENNLNLELANQNLESLVQFLTQDTLEFAKPTELPVRGFLVSAFGRDSKSNISQFTPRSGILLYTEPNSLVRTTLDGIVIYTGADDILTKIVIIYHGNYTFTKYGYLSSIEVKTLQKVKKDDIIGVSGGKNNSSLFYQVDFLYVPQSPF